MSETFNPRKLTLSQLKKKLANRTKVKKYTKGHAEEKVWINFQVTKDFKRQLDELRKEKAVNTSVFVRKALELLLKAGGDVSKVLKTED